MRQIRIGNYKFCNYRRNIEIVLLIHNVRESISRMCLIFSTDEFCGAAILFDFLCLHLFLYFCNLIELFFSPPMLKPYIRLVSFHDRKFFMSMQPQISAKNYLLNWHIFLLQSITVSLRPSTAYFMITKKFLFIPAQNNFCNLR